MGNRNKLFTVQQYTCFYCNAEPSIRSQAHTSKFGEPYVGNGLGKLNVSGGYVIKNVVPCCIECNIAKHTKSLAEFAEFIEKIYKNLLKRGVIDDYKE